MSFKNVQGSTIVGSKDMPGNISGNKTLWIRNPSWLPLPSVVSSDQKFTGLYRIDKSANFITLQFSTSAGTYHVDWGDSTSSDIASGSIAYHEYAYTDSNLAGTNGPVTFTDSTDLVTRTAHGYTDGMPISFATITTTTGITAYTEYYVINATANTFQVAATVNGSPISLTSDGSGEILSYKQAVVTVTCNTGGATFTSISLTNIHNQSGLIASYSTGWLDIKYAGSFTTQSIGNAGITMMYLESCNIVSCAVTSYSSLFTSCRALRSCSVSSTANVTSTFGMFQNCVGLVNVALFDTSSVTSMVSMFSGCTSLTSVPTFNTSSVTNMQSMFNGAGALVTAPFFDTGNVTIMTSMFQSCISLLNVPLYNMQSVTAAGSMFNGCSALVTVPLFNTSAVTNMSSMFSGCALLKNVPKFVTTSVTNMTSMFSNCSNLVTVPLFNTASVNNMSSMFSNCRSLVSVPLFNTSIVTTMASMFSSCTTLTTVPPFNTSSVTTMASMFSACTNLKFIPTFTTSGVTSMNNIIQSCTSLAVFPALSLSAISSSINMPSLNTASITSYLATGAPFSFSVANAKLSATELNAIYTNLATTTGQTITVTGNYGTSGDNPTIATAKGWTVTGS